MSPGSVDSCNVLLDYIHVLVHSTCLVFLEAHFFRSPKVFAFVYYSPHHQKEKKRFIR